MFVAGSLQANRSAFDQPIPLRNPIPPPIRIHDDSEFDSPLIGSGPETVLLLSSDGVGFYFSLSVLTGVSGFFRDLVSLPLPPSVLCASASASRSSSRPGLGEASSSTSRRYGYLDQEETSKTFARPTNTNTNTAQGETKVVIELPSATCRGLAIALALLRSHHHSDQPAKPTITIKDDPAILMGTWLDTLTIADAYDLPLVPSLSARAYADEPFHFYALSAVAGDEQLAREASTATLGLSIEELPTPLLCLLSDGAPSYLARLMELHAQKEKDMQRLRRLLDSEQPMVDGVEGYTRKCAGGDAAKAERPGESDSAQPSDSGPTLTPFARPPWPLRSKRSRGGRTTARGRGCVWPSAAWGGARSVIPGFDRRFPLLDRGISTPGD